MSSAATGWGNTGSEPEPVPDPQGRSGHWWWPREEFSEEQDASVWGNGGVVYGTWTKPQIVETPTANPPIPYQGNRPIGFVPILNHILFDFDSSELKPEAKLEVERASAILKEEMRKYPKDTLILEGHTCDCGPEAYNMTLGLRRAEAVKTALIECGIDGSKIANKSFGETQPAVPNDSDLNRKLNRRVVFHIDFKD